MLNTLGVEGASFDNRNRHVSGMDKLLENSPYEAMRCCKAADQIREHLVWVWNGKKTLRRKHHGKRSAKSQRSPWSEARMICRGCGL